MNAQLANREARDLANNPIGVCSWIFGHHNYQEIARTAAELGLDGIELLVDIYKHDPHKIKEIFSAQGLTILSMTPDNVDIASPEANTRAQSIRYYELLIEYAAALGSPAITAHEVVGRNQPVDNRTLEWQRLVDSCYRLAAKASQANIQVVFEPLNRNIVSSVINSSQALKLAQQINSDSFGIVLDTFHMTKEEQDCALAIEQCHAFLKLYQIADSNRLGIGQGETPFMPQFAALERIGYHSPVVIECCVNITGPSLSAQKVDQHRLRESIAISAQWLQQHRMTAE